MTLQELYKAAVQDGNGGRYAEAIRKLELFLTHEISAGDKANVSALLGAVHLMAGNNEQGTRRLEEALAITPNNAEGWSNLSEGLRRLERLDDAVEAARKALTLKPDYAEAYYNMGNAFKDQDKLDDAIASYREAYSLKPDYVAAYYNLGSALQDQGKLDDAIASYRKALTLKPDYAEAYNNMGGALQDQGKLDDAIASYREAYSLKPDYAAAYYNLGNALKDQDKLDDAIVSYRKALTLKPDYAEAYNNMGVALQDQGKLYDAIASYSKALTLKPDYADVHNNMGGALTGQGKLDVAIASYRQALTLQPDYVEAYFNMGNALKVQGKLDDAIASYRKALSLKPDYAEVHYNMGVTLQDQGKLDDGIASYRKALSLKPDYAAAYNNMGNALKEMGELKEAVKSYKQALLVKPDCLDTLNNIGNVMIEKGDLTAAIKYFQKALSFDPNSLKSLMHLNVSKTRAVPSWHLPMMNDLTRNNAYLKALQSAIKGDELVLDIGTGSGLLSMMAVDSGARKVFTCEVSSTISNVAKKIISKNGYNDRIKVINKKSTDLIVGSDIEEKVNILVSEILSSEFVGEGVQVSILDAKKRLLKQGGKMIPESGSIMISLIENNSHLADELFVNNINSYDLKDFNSIAQQKFSFVFRKKPVLLSQAENAFDFDLYNFDKIYSEEKSIDIMVDRDGFCAGIVQWIKMKLFKEIIYENNPVEVYNSGIASGWRTPIYKFDKPLYVKKGEVINIKAVLYEDSVWFQHFM